MIVQFEKKIVIFPRNVCINAHKICDHLSTIYKTLYNVV